MKARLQRALILSALSAGWLLIAAQRGRYAEAPRPRREQGVRLEVLDGDTYRLPSGGLVRLLGVDTPERPAPWFEGDQEPWASLASEFVRAKLAGASQVELRTHDARDERGRLLAHVMIDGEPLAALLAEAGLAAPTLDRYGDGGFPELARAIEQRARPPSFELPWRWRRRQRRALPGRE